MVQSRWFGTHRNLCKLSVVQRSPINLVQKLIRILLVWACRCVFVCGSECKFWKSISSGKGHNSNLNSHSNLYSNNYVHNYTVIRTHNQPHTFIRPHFTYLLISFVRALTVFADLYNFLTVWRSSALTVLTELCSLEKLLTAVQSCSTFRGTAKFTVKYSLRRVAYLRFLDALFGIVYW